jgi:hypothetical protein
MAARPGRQLGPRQQPELGSQTLQVRLDRARPDAEPTPDFGVRQAQGDQLGDLALARREYDGVRRRRLRFD